MVDTQHLYYKYKITDYLIIFKDYLFIIIHRLFDIKYASNKIYILVGQLMNMLVNNLDKIDTHSFIGFAGNKKRYYLTFYHDSCNIPYCYICSRM